MKIFWDIIRAIASIDSEYILLAAVIIVGLVLLRSLRSVAEAKRKISGISRGSVAVSVDGSKTVPVRHYVSDLQGLAGRPDALISEEGFIIPIERKPLARKIRDRYIAQLLVYMRLVEEFEGKRPPYGYLILGPTCRRIQIENSQERQAWLQNILDEMRQIMKGGECVATPHPRKCERCDVNMVCKFKVQDQLRERR